MLAMKYEFLVCAGLLGALVVMLAQPEARADREAFSSAIGTTRAAAAQDFFGPR
ncbi:hypothetical protein [Salipiger mangrovisoli]|uniref:Uncharacterized protein n=1 Tax=Salipiger mangrovisoli TaxID=2865933 RepID=A0ABR9X8I6_9RHOB|nr:hypothetical protein [Salipiger mangrovisoli]MBE9639904.1 hypothetical protein [Salipiger mangrovisoli]